MKNTYATLIAFVALVGLFTAGGVEATGGTCITCSQLLTKLNAIQSQLNRIPPAWSQNLPAASRFVLVLGGAAVLDKETGLVWEKSPDTTARTWSSAQSFCNDRSVGDRKGWGLPTIQQLASLVDPTQSNPALPAGHPFTNVQPSLYWSATTASAFFPAHAWFVFLVNGDVDDGNKLFETLFAWCVRGGHGGPDAQ